MQNINVWILDLHGSIIGTEMYREMYDDVIEAVKDIKKLDDDILNKIIDKVKKKTGKIDRVDTYDLCKEMELVDLYYDMLPAYIQKAELKEGVEEFLAKLKTAGKKVIVFSSNHRRTTDIILGMKDIAKYVDIMWGFEDGGKKSDDFYWQELKMANLLKPEECIVIGDDLDDEILMAKKLGFKTLHIGVDVMSLNDIGVK